ncbi:MAG: hypothetical protein AABX51_09215 [Nanoarchaeota archaeon]
MDQRKRKIFKKDWADRFNPRWILDVVKETDGKVARGANIHDIADFISGMEQNQHLDIVGEEMLLPEVYRLNLNEMDPAYFWHDGQLLNLGRFTKEELLVKGNPQQMIHDAFRKFSRAEYEYKIGYTVEPYYGDSNIVVPTVHQKIGWDIAAALTLDDVKVKILNPRPGSSSVEIPSRRWNYSYTVQFHNLPIGPEAYSDWQLLSHETHSPASIRAPITNRKKIKPTVFQHTQIAAYLLRGVADPMAAVERTRKPWQVLEDLVLLPFPPPSDEMVSFFNNMQRVYKLERTKESGKIYNNRRQLFLAEQQALLSVWMHHVGPDKIFDYTPDGKFDRAFVRNAFDRILN